MAIRLPKETVANERESDVLLELLEKQWGLPVVLISQTPERSDASASIGYRGSSAALACGFHPDIIKWESFDCDPIADEFR